MPLMPASYAADIFDAAIHITLRLHFMLLAYKWHQNSTRYTVYAAFATMLLPLFRAAAFDIYAHGDTGAKRDEMMRAITQAGAAYTAKEGKIMRAKSMRAMR